MEKFKTSIKKIVLSIFNFKQLKKSFSGFSLLELSIVLVILGILATGILRGFALIDTSRVVSLSAELNRYTVATNQFYDRYDELPGVMRDPSKYWGSKAKRSNHIPSNVRLINPSGKPTDANSLNFFNHLALAGFLEDESLYIGSNTNLPSLDSIDQNYYPFSKSMKGFFFYVRSDDIGGNYNKLNRISIASKEMGVGLNAKLIYMLDTKADDGLPLTGFISVVPTALTGNTSSIDSGGFFINEAYAISDNEDTCLKRNGSTSNVVDDYTRKSIEYNIKGSNCEFFKTLDNVEPNTVTQSAFDNAFGGASCKVDTRLCDSNSVRYVSTITNGSSVDITCPSNYSGGGSLLCSDGTLIGCKKVCTYTGCENTTFVNQYNSLPANINRNSYDNSGTRNFPLNETITFGCALGYEGNASLKCISKGTWTLTNNCTIKTCSNTVPNTPNNYNLVAGVGITNYNVNKIFYCNSCYENNTSNSISLHCGVDGGNNTKWQINSGYNSCIIKQCDKSILPSTYASQLIYQSGKTNCDKITTFDCNVAYTGTIQLKCGTNKTWEHVSGSCVMRTCDKSSPLIGYNVVGESGKINYGEIFDFNCKTGYENNTSDKVSMKCTVLNGNNVWSVVDGNACTIKKCDNTEPLEKYDVASLNGTTDYGNSALFPCLAGYTGQVEMTCNEEGKWIYKSGQCVIKTCSASNIGVNLGATYTSFNGNQISNWLKCNNDNCTVATEIVNQANILNYKEKLTFDSCKTGYEKVGTTKLIIRCNADSQWEKVSGTEKCQIVTCNHNDQDISIRNIYQEEGKTVDYNIQTIFTCKTGYKGSVAMRCNANGKWDYVGGVCNIKQCDNGSYELDSLNIIKGTSGTLSNYDTQKTFNCKTGYENSNNSAVTIRCNNEEKWEIIKGGACTIKKCDNTKPISGLYIAASTGTTNYNISKTFTCQTGYEGNVTLKCNSNAEWDYVSGQCTIVKCPAINTLTNDYGINWRTCTDNTCASIGSANLLDTTTVVYNTVITATDCPVKLPESIEINSDLLPKFICQADKTFKKLNRSNQILQAAGTGYCSSCSITRALNTSSSVIKSASSSNITKWTKWGTSDLIVNTTGYANGVCLSGYIARDSYLNRNQLFPYCINGKFNMYGNNCGVNYCQRACNVSSELNNTSNYYESLTITNGVPYSNIQDSSSCTSTGYESKDSSGSLIAIKGSIYNAKCKTGYEGDHTLTCGNNGVWTKSGQCIIKKCANNNSVISGYNLIIAEGTTDYNIQKEFLCKTGYENSSSSKMILKCNANAQWEIVSGTACTIKTCNQYTPVYGLNNTQIGTQLLDSLYLTRYNASEMALIKYCNSTQLPSTSLQITWGNTAKCMQQAGWPVETFACKLNTTTNTLYWQHDKNACSFANLNSTYTTADWNTNNTPQQTGVAYTTASGKVSEITGTCKLGYINNNQTKDNLVLASCQSNGTWSIGSNTCISGCKISDLPNTMGQNTELFINHTGGFNSYVDKVGAKAYQKYVIPSSQWARGYCNDGYEADNAGTDIPSIISATLIYCNNGQWKQSGYAVNCNKYCRNNSIVKDKNNKIIGNSLYNIIYVYESSLLYPIVYCMDNTAGASTSKQANTSFRILASRQAKCASEESWLTNNALENKYFTCQSDGTWKWTQAACLSSELQTIANNTWNLRNTSGYTSTDSTVFANGSIVKGTCNTGYTGSTTATCNSNGSWTTIGSCTIKTCSDNDIAISNYNLTTAEGTTNYNIQKEFVCKTGYENANNSKMVLKCNADKQWDVISGSACNIKKCSINNIPSDRLGHVNAKDGIANYIKCSNSSCSTTTGGALTSSSTINYNEYLTINTCNSGYTKTGSNIILRCNENSQWEKVSGDSGCKIKVTYESPFAEVGKYVDNYTGRVDVYKFNGENVNCANTTFGDIHPGYQKVCKINGIITALENNEFSVQVSPTQKYCHLADSINEANNNHINTDFQNTQSSSGVVAENGKSLTVQCVSGYGADDYYTNSSGIIANCNNGSWTFDQSRKCVKSGCWIGNGGTINFNNIRKNVIVQAWGHNGDSGGTRSCGGSGGAGGIGGYVGGVYSDSIDGLKITKISGGSGGGSDGGAGGGSGGAGYLIDLKSKKNNIFVGGGGGGGGAGGWGCSGSSCGPGRGGNGGNGNGSNGSNGTTPSGWGSAGGGAGGNYTVGCYWEWINYCIVSWDCERRQIEVCPTSYGSYANGQGGAGGGAGAGFGYYTTSCNQYVPSLCNTYYVTKGEGGHSGGDSSGCNNGGGGGGGTGGKNYVDQLSNNISTAVSAGGTYRVRICWGGNTSCNDYKANYGSALNSTAGCETGDITIE